MDNFFIDIVCESDESLSDAIKLAFKHNCPGQTIRYYKVLNLKNKIEYWNTPTTHHSRSLVEDKDGAQTLILYWEKSEYDKNMLNPPYELDVNKVVNFCIGWLKRANAGKKPDIDGELGKAWRLFTEDWGHVYGSPYAIFGLQPTYAMYGK